MDKWIEIADGFWNVRGSFKVAGLFDVGTQTSLVRLKRGDFVLLDSYPLTGDVAREVMARTDNGKAVRAILNLHPFHTKHVRAVAEQFPHAELYGTRRHKQLEPGLRWAAPHTEDHAAHALFADDLRFSVPRGVEFAPQPELSHFASVLALHEATRTLHVDDTLSWSKLPLFGGLKFHPTLRFALEKRPGAASEFRAWAEELIELTRGVDHLCTAHMRELPTPNGQLTDQVRTALADLDKLLANHARRHG
ncbi:MAG: hypothetical protein ABW321_07235 [Polyangiales bacterium]